MTDIQTFMDDVRAITDAAAAVAAKLAQLTETFGDVTAHFIASFEPMPRYGLGAELIEMLAPPGERVALQLGVD